MRYEISSRYARSCSPQSFSYSSLRRESLSEHVDSLIARSRIHDQIRASSLEPFSDIAELPTIRTSTIVCTPLSPWNKTGEFYYPRYPESWRGTAATTPLRGDYYYWSNPARYYRYRDFYPRHFYYPSRRYYPSSYILSR
ncbi:uncharacterized protein LOC111715808 isoform X1 [Eurytemora carolleeae]|uniref:uncharacterized protein LOC111715808 isoform X1 n=1 Tax=Eurytemora carolleeae TaxID=1294199 RepID=UPI000C75F9B6|nr:uncharacterized protein LOC111715808 isoform X1 [Eurytemora carolleeae]XP_023346953.1 uncharacterized protein LOC111715808 isoform X1 [Eurytemora carolleeae]|eukprot:XP_023346952.1 uncharacterized protein LOC111715808 isoform X1 [Eurytemora affinis]